MRREHVVKEDDLVKRIMFTCCAYVRVYLLWWSVWEV